MHLGAGGHDLDNQFFLDLATPQKWVSSKVCSMDSCVDTLDGLYSVC